MDVENRKFIHPSACSQTGKIVNICYNFLVYSTLNFGVLWKTCEKNSINQIVKSFSKIV